MDCGAVNVDDMAWYAFFIDPIPLGWVLWIETAPALVMFLFLVYLSIRMREKAWNTWSKRSTRSFEIFYILFYIIILIFSRLLNEEEFVTNMDTYLFSVYIIPIILISCTNFYIISSLAAAAGLLFHVVFPFLPESLKTCFESRKAKAIGICLEIVVPISAIAYVSLNIVTAYRLTTPDEENLSFKVNVIFWGSTSLILFVSFVLNVLSIVCLIVFICMLARSNVNNRMLLKLLPFFGFIIVASLVSFVLIVFFSVCNAQFEGPVFVLNSLFSFITVIAINTLTFPRDVIWCCCKCCCCWRRRRVQLAYPNVRTPLLVNNATEGMETHPALVWDHRNDPSGTTATRYHPEMTDCRSDYQQLPRSHDDTYYCVT